MPHGQLIIGAPGAGKTTYALITQNILNQLPGASQHAYSHIHALYINLDPANEGFGEIASDMAREFERESESSSASASPSKNLRIDIMDFISLPLVQQQLSLGPNGALIYCMKHIASTGLPWLNEQILALKQEHQVTEFYYIIDCPGQVELFTNESESMREIITHLQNSLNISLCCVNLIDAQYCVEPAKYIGALLTCLNSQISLELPHINVMSKMDLIQLSDDLDESETKYGELDFRLRDYLSFGNMRMLLKYMPQEARFTKLNEAIVELLENWNHVSFVPLNIEKKASVLNLLRHVNKANGFIFVGDVQNAVFNESYMEKLEEGEEDDEFD